jgi:hypothetical protein
MNQIAIFLTDFKFNKSGAGFLSNPAPLLFIQQFNNSNRNRFSIANP